jgi:hypothetical protein
MRRLIFSMSRVLIADGFALAMRPPPWLLVGNNERSLTARRFHAGSPEGHENLGSCTAALLRLLDRYGREAMAEAVAEAIEKQSPHPNSVRHVIERNAKAEDVAPAVPVALPDDPRVRDLVVHPHQLTTYDQIKQEDDDEKD